MFDRNVPIGTARARDTWTLRRLVVTVAAAGLGAGIGYGASWLLTVATCANGGCPVANDALPVMIVMALVTGWAAGVGARR